MLPRYMGLEVGFNMLFFIMFDYTPVSVHGNNFGPFIWCRAPRARTKKNRRKKDIFGLYSK